MAQTKDQVSAWRKRNPDYHREWYRKNKDRLHAYQKIWRDANREKMRAYQRLWKLKSKYGISAEEYQSLQEKQKGCCAICQREGLLVFDHCHATRKKRELLCNRCNKGLGFFEDNIIALKRAAKYVRKHSK